jgi:2-polyprenyl-6-methoxyphenol hydroxylase-like FAD-dependent oxidoreductase
MDTEIVDVVQIGYGPVGQVHAALLGQAGHRVAVFERHHALYSLPRAGHFDHEIMRIFQSLGCAEEIQDDAFPATKYEWRNGKGETLITFDWDQVGVSGWMSDYLMYQPYLENALHRAVQGCESVSVHHGWEAIDIAHEADHVAVTFQRFHADSTGTRQASEETKVVRGRYLVGADGANSFVRRHQNLAWEDLGFNESWVVLDFKQKRPLHYEFDNGQICDPARPLCLFQLGKTHRRFEYMVLPGESRDELLKAEHAWEVVKPWLTPDDAELIRHVIYTFKSGLAREWSKGRVFLVGDAAHLMPPFLGQGMCSGIRDAKNLAWKLDLVLRGVTNEALLQYYQPERSPHVKEIIDIAVQVGQVSCTVDPAEADARDAAFRNGQVPPPPPFPILRHGLVDSTAEAHPVAGCLGPQAEVHAQGHTALADDIFGGGWQLISNFHALDYLSQQSQTLLNALGVKCLRPQVSSDADGPDNVVDINESYRGYFTEQGVEAVLVRPDYYIYGAVADRDELDALIGRFGRHISELGIEVPAYAAAASGQSVA